MEDSHDAMKLQMQSQPLVSYGELIYGRSDHIASLGIKKLYVTAIESLSGNYKHNIDRGALYTQRWGQSSEFRGREGGGVSG